MNSRSKVAYNFLVSVGLALCLPGCAVILDETPEEESEYIYSTWEEYPNSGTYEYMSCRQSNGDPSKLCGYRRDQKQNTQPYEYSWQSNCRGSDCQAVNVFVHYGLQENLGRHQIINIEAFQNPQFSGYPAANIQIAGFDASRPNSTDREEIFLAPGEYYFRAYLSNEQKAARPIPLEGMVSLEDQPLGVYGALSAAKRVVVKPDENTEIVHIDINQLYKKPGSEPDQQAFLRTRITVAEDFFVPADRKVFIQLLDKADYNLMPLYSFEISSNLLRLQDQDQSAEHISPSIKPALYFVFAFVDGNGNGFYDRGELGGYYKENAQIKAMSTEAKRTRSIQVELSPFVESTGF